MSRAIDEAYFKYSVYSAMESGMQVKCPKCQGLGMITADEDNVYFKCTSCNHQKRYDRTIYRYDIHNKCINLADIIKWILKTRQNNTSLSYRYHVLIAELKCKGKFIKLPRHFHTLLKFRMEKNHILD